jgi:hypothetical protein
MWESHIRLCAVLFLLAIPIAIADYVLLKSKGGGWISLDFRGILTGAYLIVVVIHLGLSSIALKSFPQYGFWFLHGSSAVASIIVFSAGAFTIFQLKDRKDRIRYEETSAARATLAKVITLDGWTFSPDPENATEIIVSVTVSESGRFACGANGRAGGDYGEWYFHSDDVKQRQVEKGEHFKHSLPLKRSRPGVPEQIEITLYLFADSTGSAGTNVIKIFTPNPEVDDDGHNFYGVLPAPDQKSGS